MNNPTYTMIRTVEETETLMLEAREEIEGLVRKQTKVKNEAKETAAEYRSRLNDIQASMERHVGIIDELKSRRNQIEKQPELPFGETKADAATVDAAAPDGVSEVARVLHLVPPEAEPVCEACGGTCEVQVDTGETQEGAVAGELVPVINSEPCSACLGTGKPHVDCPACEGIGSLPSDDGTARVDCESCAGSGRVLAEVATMDSEVPRADELDSADDAAPDSGTAPPTPVEKPAKRVLVVTKDADGNEHEVDTSDDETPRDGGQSDFATAFENDDDSDVEPEAEA